MLRSNQADSQELSYNWAISRYFYLLVAEMMSTLVLAVVLYGEPFRFWEYAFSDLGSTATWGGKVNAPSRLVFTLGGLAASWIMLQVWAAYTGETRFRNQRTKRNLGALGTVGYLFSSVPNSMHHVLHTAGVVMAVAALVLYTLLFFWELRENMPPWRMVLDAGALLTVVLAYALAFFADWPTKQEFQKVCILGVFYMTLRAVSVGVESFRPGEVLGMVRRSVEQQGRRE